MRELQDLRSNEYLLRVVAEPDSPEHRDDAVAEILSRLAECERLRAALEAMVEAIEAAYGGAAFVPEGSREYAACIGARAALGVEGEQEPGSP